MRRPWTETCRRLVGPVRLCTVQVRAVKARSSRTSATVPRTNDDTRSGRSGSTVARDDLTIDEDCVDAGRRVAWLLPGRSGADGGRIEHDQVGCEAFSDAPPV